MENWNTRKSLLIRISDPEDHEAFEEFTYYYKNFFNMVLTKLGVNSEQASDLKQDLLLKLWKDIKKFDINHEKSNFRGWLSVVIRHEVYRFFRKNKRENDFKNSYLMKVDDETEVDKMIEEEWKAYIMTLAMEKIKDHFEGKAVEIFERTLNGQSTEEIADDLEITENSVYVLRSRVKSRLQNEVRELKSMLEVEHV